MCVHLGVYVNIFGTWFFDASILLETHQIFVDMLTPAVLERN